MAKFPFVGPAYLGQSKTIDGERSVNLYVENIDGGGTGKGGASAALIGTPGLKKFATLPDYPVRCLTAGSSRLFAVSGGTVYEVFNDATNKVLGNVNISPNPAQMFLNGGQIFIVSGGTGYIADGVDVHAVVPASTGTYINGYFVAAQPNSRKFQISGLNDGNSWDPLDFGSKDGNPDSLSAVYQAFNQLWLFGFETTEVWMNTGNANFPFQLIPGGLIQIGLYAPWSLGTIGNSILWLGGDQSGRGVVYQATELNPSRVSNHALEWKIQNEYGNIIDASAFTYQDSGHYFYVLSFPSANATWVYDLSSGSWHERAYWNTHTGTYQASLGRSHAFVEGFGNNNEQHFVGSYLDGAIYEQNLGFFTDDGNPIRRLRSCPHITDEMLWYKYHYMQVDMQTGFSAGNVINLEGPQMMMRWSDDGGLTWSNEKWASAGQLGKYSKRVIWRRNGRSRDRVYEVSSSEPISHVWVNGYVRAEKGAGV